MTEFDKFIKEKAEQAKYPYKAGAWRQFRQKAVLGQHKIGYWIAGVSTAVVVGGAALLSLSHRPQPMPPLASPIPVMQQEDSTLTLGDTNAGTVEVLVEEKSLPVEEKGAAPMPSQATPPLAVPEPEAVQAATVHDTRTQKPKTRLGRPLVIDVDTIKENLPSEEEIRNGHSRLF